jgi:hypothetical protein
LETGCVLGFDVFTAVLLMIIEFWALMLDVWKDRTASSQEGRGIYNTVVCKSMDGK